MYLPSEYAGGSNRTNTVFGVPHPGTNKLLQVPSIDRYFWKGLQFILDRQLSAIFCSGRDNAKFKNSTFGSKV